MLANFTVTNLLDSGLGSLRNAIDMANGNGEADVINITAIGTISLASQLPTITDNLIITGPGQTLFTIDAGNGTDATMATGDGFRIFNIDDGDQNTSIDVTFVGLTLTGGDSASSGGAILNRENLTLADSKISGNAASRGGGISNSSGLSVTNVAISNNFATVSGAAIENNSSGTAIIADSTLRSEERRVGKECRSRWSPYH